MIKCTKCKKTKSEIDFSKSTQKRNGFSSWCRDCTRIQNRYFEHLRRKENKEEVYRKQKKWRTDHPDRMKEISARMRLKLRMAVLNAYSGNDIKCSCCGEKEVKFLAIDHINGGGNKHRRTFKYGSYLYNFLRKNNYPKGYQILCHNCNLAKGFYGICPHKTK